MTSKTITIPNTTSKTITIPNTTSKPLLFPTQPASHYYSQHSQQTIIIPNTINNICAVDTSCTVTTRAAIIAIMNYTSDKFTELLARTCSVLYFWSSRWS